MDGPSESLERPRERSVGLDLLVLAAVLCLATFLLLPLLDSGFLTDDYSALSVVCEDLDLDAGYAFDNIVEVGKIYGRQPHRNFQLYRPTPLASYAITVLGFGPDAFVFQLTNLLLHLANGLLVFVLLRSVLPRASTLAVGAGAALFLVSPLQLEVVAWSAARSESLGLLFGLLALIVKARAPERTVLPAVLAAAALTAKESSVVFFVALFLLDVFPPRGSGASLLARVGVAFRRAVPLFLFSAAYLFLRWKIFGSLFDVNYNRQELGSFYSMQTLENYGISLVRMAMPLNEDVASEAWWGLSFRIISVLGFLGVLWNGVVAGWSSGRRLILLAAVLFAIPFALSIPMNVVTPKLVNTRPLYTPMAALAIVVALGLYVASRPWRWLPAALLLLVAVRVSAEHQAKYVEAWTEIEHTLESIREPLREGPNADARRLAVLGYVEGSYFGGGFTMSGAIRPALGRPFMDRDWYLEKVPATGPRFGELLAGDTSGLAILIMTEEPSGLACDAYGHGDWSRPEGPRLALVSPAKGAEIVVDPARPETMRIHFAFEVSGASPARVRFEFFASAWRVIDVTRELKDLPRRDLDGRSVYDLTLDATPEMVAMLRRRQAFGWCVSALDEEGLVTAGTGLRLVWVDKK